MIWLQVNGFIFVTEIYELKVCIYGTGGQKGTSVTDFDLHILKTLFHFLHLNKNRYTSTYITLLPYSAGTANMEIISGRQKGISLLLKFRN
jgi:hypothetical protein